ncbi:hypothetical protein B0H14DRAFT_3167779 [Mycena olivaceomarginata]|nr:hypothetical protein B0H14DRAFT_3167779 [Mycena olivaceomarginata]
MDVTGREGVPCIGEDGVDGQDKTGGAEVHTAVVAPFRLRIYSVTDEFEAAGGSTPPTGRGSTLTHSRDEEVSNPLDGVNNKPFCKNLHPDSCPDPLAACGAVGEEVGLKIRFNLCRIYVSDIRLPNPISIFLAACKLPEHPAYAVRKSKVIEESMRARPTGGSGTLELGGYRCAGPPSRRHPAQSCRWFPRNSVVFANNQWDRSNGAEEETGAARVVFASYQHIHLHTLPPLLLSCTTATKLHRPHAKATALHLDADSDSSPPRHRVTSHARRAHVRVAREQRAAADKVHVGGGRLFRRCGRGSRAESNATASSSAPSLPTLHRGRMRRPHKSLKPEPAADAPSNSLPLPLPLPVQPSRTRRPPLWHHPTRPAALGPQHKHRALLRPLLILFPPPHLVPKTPRAPNVPRLPANFHFQHGQTAPLRDVLPPSTFGARPRGDESRSSALSPMRRAFSVARPAGAGAIAEGAEGSPVFSGLEWRVPSDRARPRPRAVTRRAASSSSASPGTVLLRVPRPRRLHRSPSPSELGVVAEGGEKSASTKPSRRASLMRTLRGVAGRVGVRG